MVFKRHNYLMFKMVTHFYLNKTTKHSNIKIYASSFRVSRDVTLHADRPTDMTKL